MDEKYLQRIGFDGNLEDKLSEIIDAFNLGKYEQHKIITVGYEDFNIELITDTGKYFVKIFANTRTQEDINRYVAVIEEVLKWGVKHPQLLETNKRKRLYRDVTGKLQLLVMEWLEGNSFWDLHRKPTETERKELVGDAAQINKSSFNPLFTYDSWSINNFAQEFRKHKETLINEDKSLVEKALIDFQTIDHKSLPHALVHGDLISTNVMNTRSGLYLVDFSVANYLPRIQELAVLLTDLLFDSDDADNAKKMYEEAKTEYYKHIQLTDKELAVLPIYIKAAHAMHIIPPSRFIADGEDNDENRYWLNLGQKGIRLGIY